MVSVYETPGTDIEAVEEKSFAPLSWGVGAAVTLTETAHVAFPCAPVTVPV
jgi:hypothetical protein